ncbi:hypothetical protein E2C01_021682 [Portunus trituberculatus]|uniref:Uncharacterized protein n=1 Tax=Portunus trituberculatus TaxID=210409 RepID=A0A5B7E5K5_PORTR|nr:hypothetical protein [Portunus trituberculatus]
MVAAPGRPLLGHVTFMLLATRGGQARTRTSHLVYRNHIPEYLKCQCQSLWVAVPRCSFCCLHEN